MLRNTEFATANLALFLGLLLLFAVAFYLGRSVALGVGSVQIFLMGAIALLLVVPFLLRRLKLLLFLLVLLMGVWLLTGVFTNLSWLSGGTLSVLPFLTAFAGMLWLSQWALKLSPLVPSRFLLVIAVLLAFLGASAVASTNPQYSLTILISFASAMALAFLVVQLVRTPEDLGRLGWMLIVGTTIAAALLVAVRFGVIVLGSDVVFRSSQAGVSRIGGVVEGIAGTALVLSVGIAFALQYLLAPRPLRQRLFLVVSLLLMVFAQIETVSFFVPLVTGSVLLLTLFLGERKALGARARRPGRVLWRLLLVATILVGGILAAGPLQERIQYQVANVQSRGVDYLGSKRVGLWVGAIRLIAVNPWLGTGPGTAQFFIPSYSDLPDTNNFGAHSTFLGLAADAGVAASGLMLALWLVVLWSVWKALRRASSVSRDMAVYGRAILISLLALLVAALAHDLERSRWLWLLLGMGMAYVEIVKGWEKRQGGKGEGAESNRRSGAAVG